MENNSEVLEFGIKRDNEERRDGGCCVVFDPQKKKYAVYKHPRGKKDVYYLFGGGFDEGEGEEEGSLRELVEESGLIDFGHTEKIDKVITHYHNTNKNINRVAHATCFLVILNSDKKEDVRQEEHENDFDFFWATAEEILNGWRNNNHNKDYDHWVYFMEKSIKRLQELGHI